MKEWNHNFKDLWFCQLVAKFKIKIKEEKNHGEKVLAEHRRSCLLFNCLLFAKGRTTFAILLIN